MIRRRLLINAVVDPDEAATRLPRGVRPHVTPSGTVIGCCLLEIADLRPQGVPAALGRQLHATAHRISVDWDTADGETLTGVYVPVRHTDSRAAVVLGGRWFPGVHRRAQIGIDDRGARLDWTSAPADRGADDHAIAVFAELDVCAAHHVDPHVERTCLDATVGISPQRRGHLEAARMEPSSRHARPVGIDDLRSSFLDSFASAQPATSFLMRDIDVQWTAAGPRTIGPASSVLDLPLPDR